MRSKFKIKSKFVIVLITFFMGLESWASTHFFTSEDIEIEAILNSFSQEATRIRSFYHNQNSVLYSEIKTIDKAILNASSIDSTVNYLVRKDRIKDLIAFNNKSEETDLSKIRYLKGLQIIKILYEKMISLDHHFASMVTFNEINKISNPNNYPEFTQLKEVFQNSRQKKHGFGLSALLGENVYTSVLHSFMSLFSNSSVSREEKESSLKDVECIFDFTLRMHTDLNTVYFETSFLQKSNEKIILELDQLFQDYTKPIKYQTPLKMCRNNDDWDSVKELLNNYIAELQSVLEDPSGQYKAHKMRINLEFPIDRLLQFITQYNAFIDQGAKYYEKFGIMLNSYENEDQCSDKIPHEYINLKESIAIAIIKFNTAYKPVEVNGSKMKEVLYGINAYD